MCDRYSASRTCRTHECPLSNHSTQTLVFRYCKLRQAVLFIAVLQPVTAQTSQRFDTPHAAKSHVRPSVRNSDVCCRGASPAVTLSGIQTCGTLWTSHECRTLLRAFHRHRLPTRSLPTEGLPTPRTSKRDHLSKVKCPICPSAYVAFDHVTLNTRVPCPIC